MPSCFVLTAQSHNHSMCTFRGGHRRHHREHRSFRPKIALPWSVKFLKDNTISGSLEKRTSQVIDRKYIDAKVIEAHIVPGKLLLTRWLLYFFFYKEFNLIDPISWIWLASLCVLNHPMAIYPFIYFSLIPTPEWQTVAWQKVITNYIKNEKCDDSDSRT